MAKPHLTRDQELAVGFDREANLLISAAAGSGKTTTLTERIVRRLTEGLLNPSRLLVITFTELAAKDLKVKIGSRLRRERDAASSPEARALCDRLIEEMSLAQVSTIHAFCNQILSSRLPAFADDQGRAFLEPGYRILDGREEADLRDRAIDQVLSRIYTLQTGLETGSLPALDLVPRQDRRQDQDPFVLTGEDRTWAQWLSDFRSINRAYSPDLSDDSFRQALAATLDQVRNLPRYRDLLIRALDGFFLQARTFPQSHDPAVLYWWDLYESSLDRARQALNRILAGDFWQEDLVKSKTQSDIRLVDLVSLMADRVERLSLLSGHDADHWEGVRELGQRIQDFTLPSLTGARSTSERSREKDACIMMVLREVFPLAALISDRFKRSGRLAGPGELYPPVFAASVSQIRQNLQETSGPVARFIECLLLVDEAFQKLRFDQNAILFSDIEHGALAILDQEEIRRAYLANFSEIYIDEYQDTSSIQDALVHKISDRNLLMVGDIKQSIYRFRYANPSLFARYESASTLIRPDLPVPDPGPDHYGYLALLNRCFRTRPDIIDFINSFFSAFMTREGAEIDYDDKQALLADLDKWQNFDRQKGDQAPRGVFLDIATCLRDPVEERESAPLLPPDLPTTSTGREAMMAARIIRDLVKRGVAYDRIAILLPTNQHCRDYEESLALCGIPVSSRSGRIYPDSLVFRQLEALLEVLDNPRQDIPLISLMLGPFAPEFWTGEEILSLAGLDRSFLEDALGSDYVRGAGFSDKFFILAGKEDLPLARKAQVLADQIDRWRFLARDLSAHDLLDLIFFETSYHDYLAQSQFAQSYLAELDLLMDLVEEEDLKGATGPRKALDRLKAAMEDKVLDGSSDGILLPGRVRVLTRHASKGLEWDYVILGKLHYREGDRSGRQILFFSEETGLSSASLAREGMTVFNNPPYEAARAAEAGRDLAESRRLLYVAMTRAIHGLYLLLPVDQAFLEARPAYRDLVEETHWALRHLARDQREGRGLLPPALVKSLKTDADLLLAWLAARYPSFTDRLMGMEAGEGEGGELDPAMFPSLFSGIRLGPWAETAQSLFTDLPRDEVAEEAVLDQKRPAFRQELSAMDLLLADLPFKEAAQAPAKVTVTELQRLGLALPSYRDREEDSPEALHTLGSGPEGALSGLRRVEIPLSMRGRSTGRFERGMEVGTVIHKILRFLNLASLRSCPPASCLKVLDEQVEDMVRRAVLTEEERDLADLLKDRLVDWARSDLADRLLRVETTTGRVYREIPFTLSTPSKTLDARLPEEEITLIQGMIDLWFVEEDGQAVLIDFKTDRLPAKEGDRILADRYRIQIESYAEAIRKATGRQVKERIIWLVREGRPLHL